MWFPIRSGFQGVAKYHAKCGKHLAQISRIRYEPIIVKLILKPHTEAYNYTYTEAYNCEA